MRELHVRHDRPRRSRLVWGAAVVVTTVTLVGAAFMSISAANLPGSGFESGDGNLVVNTPGNTDWANAPALVVGLDQFTGSSDNALGQGTKEDNAAVKVVQGSIPNNKSDLTRFYEASEFANGQNYLYLAWERANVLGSANMDFEINQATTPAFTTTFTGPLTLNRTPGDMLITFDFGGSGTPALGLLRWVTTGPVAQCFSANALPCWGNRVDLSASGFAEGSVNSGTATDPIAPNAPRSLPGQTFGEAAVNLSAAGVFPAGTCETFGSAFLKSRSSASFTAEVKDFIAPQSVNVSNCGTIKIHKVTENGDGTFGFTAGPSGSTTTALVPAGFNLSNGGTQLYTNVASGSYTVTESAMAAGSPWTLKSLTCTTTGSGTSAPTSGATASITLAAGGVVDCTYVNHRNLSPTISTVLSAISTGIGVPVNDTSSLSGASADAGGTVTYTVYTDANCSQGGQSAGTKTVSAGIVPNSDSISFAHAGDYYWQAVYSGDANNDPATSTCTDEHLVVTPNQSGMTTAQKVIPNDSATLTGLTSGAGGTVTLSLFGPADATCSSTPALSQTLNVSGSGAYSTTNSSFVAQTAGTWKWKVSYSGDGDNLGTVHACGADNFTITNG